MLNEISQLEKVKEHMMSLPWDIKLKATNQHKLIDTDNSMVVTGGKWGCGEGIKVRGGKI